jgi:hypothetical protein
MNWTTKFRIRAALGAAMNETTEKIKLLGVLLQSKTLNDKAAGYFKEQLEENIQTAAELKQFIEQQVLK